MRESSGTTRFRKRRARESFTLILLFGALPLVLSTGPGHETRTVIGIVVMCGVTTASLITLFAIPVAYKLLAGNTRAPGTVARELQEELARL